MALRKVITIFTVMNYESMNLTQPTLKGTKLFLELFYFFYSIVKEIIEVFCFINYNFKKQHMFRCLLYGYPKSSNGIQALKKNFLQFIRVQRGFVHIGCLKGFKIAIATYPKRSLWRTITLNKEILKVTFELNTHQSIRDLA